MSLLEKYVWFQKGIVKSGADVRLQKFFKTNPTEEQIMMLDDMDKINNTVWLTGLLLYFIMGILAGYLIFSLSKTVQTLSGA